MAGAMSPRNEASLGTARVIPVFLALIVAYVSWVVVGPLSIDYLINSPEGVQPRVPAGIAIPIVWFFLLLPVAATYLRLLLIVFRDPGYVRQGEEPFTNTPEAPAPGLEQFYTRDVFVCDSRGLPIWCQSCHNWKPDRVHHNQDVGRCTLKMDHFCPWVGGVVGERSYKFFVQFLVYSFILSTYGMIVLAFFVAEAHSNVQWIVALALAGFFALFTLGMVMNSLWMVFRNVSTIENINMNPGGRTMLLAVLLPPALQNQSGPIQPPGLVRISPSKSDGSENRNERPTTSDLDDPSHVGYFSNERLSRPSMHPSKSEFWRGTVTYPLSLPADRPPLPAPIPRTFAILETLPGLNPWDLGSPWRNFTAVFGHKFHQWLLPIRHSPCCDHSSAISQYPLGPQFEQLLIDAGLTQVPPPSPLHDRAWGNANGSATSKEKSRRKRRLAEGWQNGERPNGWISEKEARRLRNESRRRMKDDQQDVVP